ncbi:MAG: M23 family metallopeptidase [Actinobacteria bacterium]|nr:M23 family metallopeptidase [Actinomycetota bacterium]
MTLPRLELVPYRTLVGPDSGDGPSVGLDVLAWKRMLKRWDAGSFSGTLATLDTVFNRRTVHATQVAQRFWKLRPDGEVGPVTFARSLIAQRERGARKPVALAWDALAISLHMKSKPLPLLRRCFLYPASVPTEYLGGVADHMRRALGNWQSDNAIDVHAPAGSIVVSPKPGYVSKVGGYDPHRGPVGTIFGEHTTIEFDDGTAGFLTHLDRIVGLGERLVAGEIIGKVGDWPHSFIMDHAHFGARGFNPEAMLSWPRVRIPFSD